MTLAECPTCKKTFFSERYKENHVCPPKWEILDFEYESEWRDSTWWPKIVYANTNWDAAEKYADQRNIHEEYFMLNDDEGIKIKIRRAGSDDPWKVLRITAEPAIDYYVDGVRPKENNDDSE